MVITFLKSKGKKWQWISSLLMFAVLIIFSVIVDAEDYVYDNHFYWTYGDAVVADR